MGALLDRFFAVLASGLGFDHRLGRDAPCCIAWHAACAGRGVGGRFLVGAIGCAGRALRPSKSGKCTDCSFSHEEFKLTRHPTSGDPHSLVRGFERFELLVAESGDA